MSIDVLSNMEQKCLPWNGRSRKQSFSVHFPGKWGGAHEVLTRKCGSIDQGALPTNTNPVYTTTHITDIKPIQPNTDPTFNPATAESQDGIIDKNIKMATLVGALHDHALTWYMKYSSDHPNEGLVTIQEALNKEFGQPKSEAQSVIRFKEIVMMPGETPWDLDQRLKSTIHEANMTLTNE